jgi:6-phosphofructo-2-kinase
MSNRVAAMSTTPSAPPPLNNITNITERDFALPKPLHNTGTLLAPPLTTSLGRVLQAMGSNGVNDGVGHALSDTPLGSAPSTAPSSPRM